MLVMSSKGEIIFEEENCLDVSKSYAGAPVEILKCHGMGGNQKWEHDKKSVSLYREFFYFFWIIKTRIQGYYRAFRSVFLGRWKTSTGWNLVAQGLIPSRGWRNAAPKANIEDLLAG